MTDKQEVNKTNEILGLIYLLIAAILGVAYYIPAANSGPLGTALLNVGKGLVGPSAYAFPVLFLILAVTTFLHNLIRKHKIRVNHIFLIVILTASLFHAFSVEYEWIAQLSTDELGQQTVFKTFEVLWKGSQDPSQYELLQGSFPGGVLGGLVALGLQRVTGRFGAIAILITAILAEAVVLGNFSIERILRGIGAVLGFIFRSIGNVVQNASNALYDLTSGKLDDPEEAQAESMATASGPTQLRAEIPVRTKTAKKKANDLAVGGESSGAKPVADSFSVSDIPIDTFVIPSAGAAASQTKAGQAQAGQAQIRNYTVEEFKAPDFLLTEADRKQKAEPKPSSQDFLLQADENEQLTFRSSSDEQKRRFKDQALQDMKTAVKPVALPDIPQLVEEEVAPIQVAEVKPSASAGSETESLANEPDLLELAEEKPYEFPPLTLLEPRPVINSTSNTARIHELAAKLEATLASFGVEAKVVHITTGPSITRFELRPGVGVKISKIVGLGDDIALSLAAMAVRIEAPIPGKSAIGIEIPNPETAIVGLRSLLEAEDYKSRKEKLLVPLGRDIPGQPIYCDLAKMPHLLIAGATGSGKSISINSILISLLYRNSPQELKLILIDPKVVELSVYNGIPHLMAPVVTDPKKAANTLNWAVNEMTRRYQLFAERQVRDMRGYNEDADSKGYEKLPFIVIIIDELSDLMAVAANEVEDMISRLTAMARAAGIHLIIATQRPSVDVITGVIKANVPSRLAFAVASQVDSRTILDGGGAEKLLGKGDMLYSPQSSSKPTRGQGAFVSDHEVENVVSFLKAQKIKAFDKEEAEQIINTPAPGVDTGGSGEEPEEDELLDEAVDVVLDAGYASVSVLQRRLNIGYPRAGRLIDAMEMKGYIGPFVGSKPRQVILTRTDWALRQAQNQLEEKQDDSADY